MWRVTACAIVLALAPLAAEAQGLAGAFRSADSGSFRLTLEEDGDNLVTGTLVMDGRTWDVAGVRDGAAAIGEIYPSGDDEADAGFYFRAEPSGSGLALTLVAVGPDGSPVDDSRRDLSLSRDGAGPSGDAPAAPAAPGSPAGPLSGLAGGSGFTGVWNGDVLGTATVLTLREAKGRIEGDADAAGYAYRLEGKLADGAASGTFSDPATGGSWEFELSREGEAVVLTLLVPDPATGRVQRSPFTFRPGRPEAPAAGGGTGAAPEAGVTRDPVLVGRWTWSESYVSGDFSAVTQKTLLIYPDGRFVLGDGRVAGGGDAGSFDSGGGGGVEAAGEWKTVGNIVHVKDQGTAQWYPYARYYVEGNSLMFTFGDGSRKIWKRN